MNGSLVTLGGVDQELATWDLQQGTAIERVPTPGQPRRIACSPDGRHLAVGSALDDGVQVWPYADRAAARLLPSPHTTRSLAFLSDDLLLVVDGGATAWRIEDPPRVAWRVACAEGIAPLEHAAVVGDAVALLVVAKDGGAAIDTHRIADGVRVRSVAIAEPLPSTDLDGAFVRSPAGDAVAWGHAYGDGEVRMFDLADGRVRARTAGRGAGVGLIDWNDRGLIVGFADGTVRAFDPQTGREVGTLPAHAGWVSGLASLPDGDLVTSGSDGTLYRWGPTALAAEADPSQPITAQSIFALGDGDLLTLDAREIHRRPFSDGPPRWSVSRTAGTYPVMALAPDRGEIAIAQTKPWKSSAVPKASTCVVLDGATGRSMGMSTFSGAVRAAIFADGRCHIATAEHEDMPESDRPLVVLTPGRDDVARLAAWGYDDSHALVRVTESGPLVVALDEGRIATVSPADGRILAASKAHSKPVTALLVAADGTLFSIANDGTVRAWELDPLGSPRGFAVERNPRPRYDVVPHALVDEGRALAIGTGLPFFEIYALADASLRVRIDLPGPLKTLAAPARGDWVAAALQDGTVIVHSRNGDVWGRWSFPGTLRQLVAIGPDELAVRDQGGRLHGLRLRGPA